MPFPWPLKRKRRFRSYLIFLFIIINNGMNNKSIVKLASSKSWKDGINSKSLKLNDRFNDFEAKYEMVNSNMSISRCCDEFLLVRTTQLECNNLNNAQYNRKETLEIKPTSSDIANNILKRSVCYELSFTGITVKLNELQACDCMRKTDQVTIKFKCRKLKHRIL